MALKPIHLITYPLVLFILMGIVLGSAEAWQNSCGMNLSCNASISIFSSNSPLFLLLTGDLSAFWAMMQTPTFDFSIVTAIISIIVGFFLLLMALGITISAQVQALTVGASGSIGFNEQSTKMAQVLGPGLLIWGLLQLSMPSWGSGFDMYINGLSLIFSLILEIIFITGLWWMVHSRF
jgi:hypothetical protein